MRRASRTILLAASLACLGFVCFFGYVWGLTPNKQERRAQYMSELLDPIRAQEKVLRTYAQDLLVGKVEKEPGFVSYTRAGLPRSGIGQRIRAVTRDENGNVYFVLTDSRVTFTHGFVLRNADTVLLGDQLEPEIRSHEHLFGKWWYYHAR